MKQKTVWLIAAAVALVLVGAFLVLRLMSHAPSGGSSATMYYCPMHPTYTADRPGSCPICNMSLVKREEAAPAQQPSAQAGAHAGHQDAAQQAESICILHNCAKFHNGKPCPMTVVATPGEHVKCPVCGTYLVGEDGRLKKLLYWTDPMIPNYRADGPGKSPMGMDLVPVYEEAAGGGEATQTAEGYAPVLLTPQKQQLIGVKTSVVELRTLTKTIRTVGKIAYDPELYQAEQEYLQALRAYQRAQQGTIPEVVDQSKRLVDSARIRLRLLGLSDELIDGMADWEGPDQSLLFADPGKRVWLYATVYEYELPFVAVGQTIHVEIPSRPGTILESSIRSIDPVLDPKTRSARVRATLTDTEGLLKPEMYVNALIAVTSGEALSIPEEAVFDTGTKRIVFVDKGQGLFEPRDVAIGLKADGFYEVKNGLSAGARVVTSGNFLIDSESRLKAALDGMGNEGHQHGQ